jgi:calcium permeable stress-gated cation channel
LAATTALCLLWTIPISFFASLSSVGALREKSGFIDKMLDTAPFLKPLLEIIAPFLVVIVNGLLPTILKSFCLLEGQISGATIEASLFSKLCAFMIIQTFFVSAISGGILQELANIIDSPKSIISLLAKSLPQQSTYFLQILIVYTTVTIGLEMLRVLDIVFAFIRRFVGPNLTEKERKRPFIIFRPLDNPNNFSHASFTAQMVLYMTVLMVYASIAPLSSIILAACFYYIEAVYRHQFIYIYPNRIDSGGQLWINFMRIVFVCMLIAQVTSKCQMSVAITADVFCYVKVHNSCCFSVCACFGASIVDL